MSNDGRVFILSPLSNSNIVTVLIVNCFKLKCSLCPHSAINQKTILISHTSAYLSCGGLRLKMPLMNFLINGYYDISANSGI